MKLKIKIKSHILLGSKISILRFSWKNLCNGEFNNDKSRNYNKNLDQSRKNNDDDNNNDNNHNDNNSNRNSNDKKR